MVDAFSLAGSRVNFFSRARINWNVPASFDLLAPALLLGLWRAWSTITAPKLGVYFSAEAVLIAYAYFAVVRTVHVNARSHDRTGSCNRALRLQAGRSYFRGLQRYGAKVAIVLLSFLTAALALDMLTAHTGIQHRPNLHLSVLFVEILVWARYGSAVIIASAQWSPPRPAAFAAARRQADTFPVARSFALTNIAFGVAAVAVLIPYKLAGAYGLCDGRTELIWSAAVFTGLAWLALWLQCRWALRVVPRLDERSVHEPPIHGTGVAR